MRSLKDSNPSWFANRKARLRHCPTLRRRPGSVLHSKTTIFDSSLLPKHSPELPRWLRECSKDLSLSRPETRAGPETSPERGSPTFPYFPFVKTRISVAAACLLMPPTQPPAPAPLYCLRHYLRPVSLTPPHTPRRVGGFEEACGHMRRPWQSTRASTPPSGRKASQR